MIHLRNLSAKIGPVATKAALAAAVILATSIGASAADNNDRGLSIFKGKGGCSFCHGWAGDGAGDPHAPGRAASLRATKLTEDQIREVVQCGRPGTGMPHFDRFAYTDKRCYGSTAADLGDQVPTVSSTALQPAEVKAVSQYVAQVLKGEGPATKEQCIAYFGSDNSTCSNIK